MDNSFWDERTRLLVGESGIADLRKSRVLVAGLGGVGGFATEMLCRAGIGNLTIVDVDIYQLSNINRQIGALHTTRGKYKTEITAGRLMDINNDLNLKVYTRFLDKAAIDEIFSVNSFDYVVDAIDTLKPKFTLIHHCLSNNIRIVSSMGAGARLDPSRVLISDISESYNCRLAYYIRKKLHVEGIYSGFKVVFSPEPVRKDSIIPTPGEKNKRSAAGTISYMPAIFGIYAASEVIQELINS